MPTFRRSTNKANVSYNKPWAGIVHWKNLRYYLGQYYSPEEAELGEIRFKLGMLEDRQKELIEIIARRKIKKHG